MSSPGAAQLRALAALISSSVDILDEAYTRNGVLYPSLDNAYSRPADDDAARAQTLARDENVVRACATICAAANQLIYTVRDPNASALFGASAVSWFRLLLLLLRCADYVTPVSFISQRPSASL